MLPYLKKQKFKQKFGLIELTKQLEREPFDSILYRKTDFLKRLNSDLIIRFHLKAGSAIK